MRVVVKMGCLVWSLVAAGVDDDDVCSVNSWLLERLEWNSS